MTEHKPWIGGQYDSGVNGRKIAIVGFSHHVEEKDNADVTIDLIKKIQAPDPNNPINIAFFTKIRNYFGFSSHKEFWDQVIFFNFIPDSVGGDDERYSPGERNQRDRGAQRLAKIFEQYAPDIALVFSNKAWDLVPEARENTAGLDSKLGAAYGDFRMWHYDKGQTVTAVYRLPHPQGANGQMMREAVRTALEQPKSRGGPFPV